MATLYRKYRPQTFGDLVGQEHIRQTLQSALKQGRFGHAYLFSGPRGTGKTSVARLLAKTINCLGGTPEQPAVEPCNTCQICVEVTEGRSLDVIEIDAASNRGIDEIRELREKIKFAPTQARKKIFIIDEVHMLTKEAFNALLKTLEEPPAHAVFVMATTEIHKVPVTISSRCQTFVFKKAATDNLVSRLQAVAEAEQIAIDPAAVAFLARLAGGSYRDALSLLDQVSSFYGDTLTLEAVQNLLGLASEDRLLQLLELMTDGHADQALAFLGQLESDGIDPEQFASQLIDAGRTLLHVRLKAPAVTTMLSGEEKGRWQKLAGLWDEGRLLEFIRELIAARQLMKQAALPVLPLEVVIVKTARGFGGSANGPIGTGNPGTEKKQEKSESETVHSLSPENRAQRAEAARATAPRVIEAPEASEEIAGDESEIEDHGETEELQALEITPAPAGDYTAAWRALLERIRAEHMSIHGLLQQAEFAGVEDGKLIVRVPFQFAADRLGDKKHRAVIEGLLADIFGPNIGFNCIVHAHERPVIVEDGPLNPEVADAALEIFGIDESKPN